MKKINIAIDGFSSTGKSTLAKALAQKLQYTYIDSGAMYRAITLYILENNFNLQDETSLKKALADIQLEFRGKQIFLNNKNVDQAIRSMKVAEQVSQVATIPMIRDFCVAQQQAFGIKKGVVMDGRDIGTVVFPDAELKIYLTAQEDVRVDRRFNELVNKGETISKDDVAKNLMSRDKIDSERSYNPLRKASDAIELDNSSLDVEQQLDFILHWVDAKLETIETD